MSAKTRLAQGPATATPLEEASKGLAPRARFPWQAVGRFRVLWIPIGLVLAGFVTHYWWLTGLPLSAGDWSWVSDDRLRAWFPWPGIWDPFVGLGVKNFAGAYTFPLEAAAGVLGVLGAGWAVGEKVVFFWPFAALSFLAPWLLARELLGSSRWAILSALIFASNTYLLIISTGGQLLVAIAEVLAPLVLLAFIRAMRHTSIAGALLCGLLISLQAIYEVRITYLTGLLCALYLLVLVLHQPDLRLAGRRVALALLPAAVLIASQLYWLVPLLNYHGDYGLPIALAPWLAFMQITHGITGVHPFWTGASPTFFQPVALNPVFFLIPVVAFGTMLIRRVSAETIWLCLAALAAAFLIKQDNPPLGAVYDWLFFHVPGWSAFREASKLFFVVALSYSVLVPISLRHLAGLRVRAVRTTPPALAVAATLAIVAISANNLVPTLTGQLRFTTQPRPEPASFVELTGLLDTDRRYGAVVWLGGASVGRATGEIRNLFPITSLNHPLVEVSGLDVNDVLGRYCHTTAVPFCYVDKQLFPYLLERLSASYVVAPAGDDVGSLPPLVSVATLEVRLSAILGPARRLGTGSEALAIWQTNPDAQPVSQSSAVAVVDGRVGDTRDVAPALQALGVPAVYQLDRPPSDPAALPGPTINVIPNLASNYQVLSPGRFGVMARTTQAGITVVDGARRDQLPRLATAARSADWTIYGPMDMQPGVHRMFADDGTQLGPALEWSSQSLEIVTGAGAPPLTTISLQPEQIVAGAVPDGARWIELRRTYDSGWRMGSQSPSLVGDGMFNLYWAPAVARTATFSYSTSGWESLGVTAALVITMLVVVLWLVARRSGRRSAPAEPAAPAGSGLLSSLASQSALTGLGLLVLAAFFQCVGWFGVASSLPWIVPGGAAGDPYLASEFFVAISMVAFLISAALHLLDPIVRR